MPFTPDAPVESGILEFLKGTQSEAAKGALAGEERVGKIQDKLTEEQFRKELGLDDTTPSIGGTQGQPKMIIVSPEQEELFLQQGSKVKQGTQLTPGAFNYLMRKPLDEKKYLLTKSNADITAAKYKLSKQKVYFNILTDIYEETGIPEESRVFGKRVPFSSTLQEQYKNEIIPIIESYGFTSNDFPHIWKSAGMGGQEDITLAKPDDVEQADWDAATEEQRLDLLQNR